MKRVRQASRLPDPAFVLPRGELVLQVRPLFSSQLDPPPEVISQDDLSGEREVHDGTTAPLTTERDNTRFDVSRCALFQHAITSFRVECLMEKRRGLQSPILVGMELGVFRYAIHRRSIYALTTDFRSLRE
jgi:hypothetical protein